MTAIPVPTHCCDSTLVSGTSGGQREAEVREKQRDRITVSGRVNCERAARRAERRSGGSGERGGEGSRVDSGTGTVGVVGVVGEGGTSSGNKWFIGRMSDRRFGCRISADRTKPSPLRNSLVILPRVQVPRERFSSLISTVSPTVGGVGTAAREEV